MFKLGKTLGFFTNKLFSAQISKIGVIQQHRPIIKTVTQSKLKQTPSKWFQKYINCSEISQLNDLQKEDRIRI